MLSPIVDSATAKALETTLDPLADTVELDSVMLPLAHTLHIVLHEIPPYSFNHWQSKRNRLALLVL